MFLFLATIVVSIVLAGAGAFEGRRGRLGPAIGFLAAAVIVLAVTLFLAVI